MRKTIKQVKKAVAALMALVMVLGVGVPVMADTSKEIELPEGITMTLQNYIKTTTVPAEIWDADTQASQIGEKTIHWIAPGSEIILVMNAGEVLLTAHTWFRMEDGTYIISGSGTIWPEWWEGDIPTFVMSGMDGIGERGAWSIEGSPSIKSPLIKVYIASEGTPETQPAPTNNIIVTINGTAVDFADQQPALVDGRTLVPVRGVFEQLGFEVDWDNENRQAILERDDYIIIITIDSEVFTTNGVEHRFDVPAQTIGGRTMVPIRFVLESVGYELDWDGDTQTVIISTN